MAIDQALLEKARLRPHALRLEEALRLSRQLGFAKVRQGRGPPILRHAAAVALNLQAGRPGYAQAHPGGGLVEGGRAWTSPPHATGRGGRPAPAAAPAPRGGRPGPPAW